MADVRETLTTLLAFPRDLAGSRTLEIRLRLTAETGRQLTAARTAVAAWAGLESSEITLVACSTAPVVTQMPRKLAIDREAIESMFHHKTHVTARADSAEARDLGWSEADAASVIAVPIRSCGHVGGWLAVGDAPAPDALAAPHDRILVSLAEQAGRALECSEVTNRAAELDSVKATAATLSHDLNNLLTSILGYGRFIVAAAQPGEPIRNDAEEVVRSAQKGAELSQRLLELSRGRHHAPARVGATNSPPPAQAHLDRRVLVVEDERAVRYLVRTILSRNGFEVVEAAGPSEADAWFVANPDVVIDLMITDLVMPGASGVEVFGRARARRPGLRVLYMSGFGDDALDGAGGRFVQKPFTADDLMRAVSAALETHTRTA